AGKYRTLGQVVVPFQALLRVFDKVKNAAEVRADATVSNDVATGQLDHEARNLAHFHAFGVVFLVRLLEHERQAGPLVGEVALFKRDILERRRLIGRTEHAQWLHGRSEKASHRRRQQSESEGQWQGCRCLQKYPSRCSLSHDLLSPVLNSLTPPCRTAWWRFAWERWADCSCGSCEHT